MRLSRLHKALVDALPCHVAAFDAEGQIVLTNEAWREFARDNGLPDVDWTSANYFEACRNATCPDGAATIAGAEEILAGRSTHFVLEYPCHSPAGTQRWFRLLAVPFEAGQERYVLTLHRVITERHLLEVELGHAHKMEAVGRLASGVAHDFNNLLMGIAGTANIGLRRVEADSPLRYYLDEIKSAAVGGAAITKQLLAFSRKCGLTRSRQDIDEIVLKNEGMLRQLIGESIDFEVRSGFAGGAVYCADGQIEQILMNLVANARDAMPDSGTVTIATCAVEIDERSALDLEPGRYCLLTISDTGGGMDVDTQQRIFEPFFTTKGVGQGTGLGLSTVYGIVTSVGGLIRVVSVLGHGTTFEIYLPQFEGEADAAGSGLEPAGGGSETVLVVEDEPLVRDTVREYLSDAGYRVLVASDGVEARRAYRRVGGAVDLLVTDMILPRTTGAQVAREIRAHAPNVAVVFMSAYPREMLLESGRIADDDIVLHKPFDDQVLLRAVRTALGSRAAPSSAALGPVLVVDDDELCRSALVELFEDAGHTVIEAGTAREAFGWANEAGADIAALITDFQLPDSSGAELVERLAARGSIPPVLYLSGHSGDEPEIADALQRARTKFVQKPAEFDEILAALEALIAST